MWKYRLFVKQIYSNSFIVNGLNLEKYFLYSRLFSVLNGCQ